MFIDSYFLFIQRYLNAYDLNYLIDIVNIIH